MHWELMWSTAELERYENRPVKDDSESEVLTSRPVSIFDHDCGFPYADVAQIPVGRARPIVDTKLASILQYHRRRYAILSARGLCCG